MNIESSPAIATLDTLAAEDAPRASGAESADLVRAPSFSFRANLMAALGGFRFLVNAIGPTGVQSDVSPDPSFPTQRTVAIADMQSGRLPEGARRALAGFRGATAETFTSFLALKLFGPILGRTAAPIVAWARHQHLPNLRRYHFFSSPDAIAADIDCTGVALVGLHRVGALSRRALYQGAEQLLQSAALESVPESQNRSHGKSNGPLFEGVFKVYWDDYAQGGHRGRKHDPSCVANALHAVLLASRAAGFSLGGVLVASERQADGSRLTKCLDRALVLERNIAYLQRCLEREAFAQGTRYYPSPDAFLCFASALMRDFPGEVARLRGPLLEALSTRWHQPETTREDPANPGSSINLAMRIITAQNLGVRESAIYREKARLLEMQRPSGGWPAAALFQLGSLRCYFGSAALSTIFALRALLGPLSASDPGAISHW